MPDPSTRDIAGFPRDDAGLLRVMLFAGEPVEAEAILRALRQGRVAVRGMFTQQPLRLAKLFATHACDLIIATLSGSVTAADMAAGYRDLIDSSTLPPGAELPPLVVVFGPDQPAADLLDLTLTGSATLVEACAIPSLVDAVRRQAARLGMAERLAVLEAENTALRQSMRGLVAAVEEPIARVRDGHLVEFNPAFERRFDRGDGSSLTECALYDLVAPGDHDTVSVLLGANLLLEMAEPPSNRVAFIEASGQSRPYRLALQTCGSSAPNCHWVVLTPDAPSVGDAAVAPAASATLPVAVPDLAARAALRNRLEELLTNARTVNPSFALVYILVPDFALWLRATGWEQVETEMAALVMTVAQAAPAHARCARIADDAVAAVIEDAERTDRSALRTRFTERLAGLTGNEGVTHAPLGIGVVVAETGEYTLGSLLDQALAEARPGGAAPRGAPGKLDLDSEGFLRRRPTLESVQARLATSAVRRGPPGPAPARASDVVLDPLADPNSIESKIERGLTQNSLGVMYQPIISLMGDSQEHYSVLLRLEDINNMMLSAADLLGPAARSGQLPAVDRWVISKALGELVRWRRLGQRVGLFISLSAETLQDDELLIYICDSLREHDARGGWVTFQVQEREVRANLERWVTLCEGLHKIACRVAINQFGHDPKPAELLKAIQQDEKRLQVDFVKFAPEFAVGLATDIDKQRRLFALGELAHQHDVRTIVSGVEDGPTLTLLWGNRFDYVQGNFVQAPGHTLEVPTE